MRANIIQIGNSQGIRIPKVLLQESGIKGEVELEIHQDGILLRNISKPRAEWDRVFQSLRETDDDVALAEAVTSGEFETREWQW
jgi:antitoxin MazE